MLMGWIFGFLGCFAWVIGIVGVWDFQVFLVVFFGGGGNLGFFCFLDVLFECFGFSDIWIGIGDFGCWFVFAGVGHMCFELTSASILHFEQRWPADCISKIIVNSIR